jgi:hypothetical protein
MFRRNRFSFILTIIPQLLLAGFCYAQTQSSWPGIVEKLQKRVALGNLGDDVSITFQNSPYKKYMEDELLAYTFRSDGEVIIQMNDQVKTIKVTPEELLWLARFLIEHKVEDFPEKEPKLEDSASFAIIIKVGSSRKGVWLYNRGNDKNRDAVWQYLLYRGQTLLETAGLRDKSQAILPVCEGVKRLEELDINNDGTVEWLRLKIGFHAFRAGQYTFDFSGVRHSVFLAQGSIEKDFFLNTYLLRPGTGLNREYLTLAVDSQPPCPVGPFRMDLGLELKNYPGKNFRTSPDFVFAGPGKGEFALRLHQSAIVEVKKNQSESGNKLLRFTLSEMAPEGVRLTGKDEPVFLAREEKIPLADFGCLSGIFGLSLIDPGMATFEVSWNIPEQEMIRKKIEYFQEILVDDDYQGDKESARSSLDFCQECLGLLDGLEDLKINVIYTTPAEAT